ncbi:RsiV family protein [Spirosoma sp.]|uniref:RsiV family protein n=1 Tax=Spirosoma sp. TaxID=1899569 RepID=UPI002616A436|nr:RsiV family protein [Spirosoma sp.]MCX6215502.1 RsiV family protein [Spirosoma sp.]
MKYFLALFLGGSITLLSACHSRTSELPLLGKQHFTYAGANRCDTTKNSGVDVAVSYILLKDESDGGRKINDSLRQLAVSSITGWLDSTTIANNPQARTDLAKAAALFAADYETVRKDMGSLGGCWEVKTAADTLHVGEKALTAKFETFAYTGGAHPNTNMSLYNFDRETGRLLTLSDMVSDTTALLALVEKAFRKQQALSPQNNLEEQGYFLRDGHFFLPANVGMSSAGMLFYYNPYEIAAYAVGPIQVTVPYEQLKGILREDWL